MTRWREGVFAVAFFVIGGAMPAVAGDVAQGGGIRQAMLTQPQRSTPARPQTADHHLFGAAEQWLGETAQQLSPDRLRRLADQSAIADPELARKWDIVVKLIHWQSPINRLKLVQQYFNSLPYRSDIELYRTSDYWASVEEFMRQGGDCEDYVIVKYRALVEGGFPENDLRVVLLEDSISQMAHAVLAAYVDGKIYILDNQRRDVALDREIGNYRPLYSLNETDVWRHRREGEPTPALSDITISTRAR